MNCARPRDSSSSSSTIPSTLSSFASSLGSSLNPPRRRSIQLSPPLRRSLLGYVRLLILMLAFATLILDAITISFETNVMTLPIRRITDQVLLLLMPDLLAITLSFLLLVYQSRYCSCCLVSHIDEDDDPPHHIHHHNNEVAVEHKHEHDHDNATRSSLVSTFLDIEKGSNRQEDGEGRWGSRPGSSRSGPDSPSQYCPTTEGQSPSSFQELLFKETRGAGAGLSSSNYVASQRRHDDHDAIVPAVVASTVSVPAEAGPGRTVRSRPQQPPQGQRPQRSWIRTLYIVFRLAFSFGLFALAIYWPIKDLEPPSVDQVNSHLNSDTNSDVFPLQRRSVLAVTDEEQGNSLLSNVRDFRIASADPILQRSTFTRRDEEGDRMESSARSDESAIGVNIGHGHKSEWCGPEKAFGDEQSAIVFCHATDIRPIMTYIWAGFLLLELAIAYFEGDLSLKSSPSSSPPLPPPLSSPGNPDPSTLESQGEILSQRN